MRDIKYWQMRCIATQRALESVLAAGYAYQNTSPTERAEEYFSKQLDAAETVLREQRKNDKTTMILS